MEVVAGKQQPSPPVQHRAKDLPTEWGELVVLRHLILHEGLRGRLHTREW